MLYPISFVFGGMANTNFNMGYNPSPETFVYQSSNTKKFAGKDVVIDYDKFFDKDSNSECLSSDDETQSSDILPLPSLSSQPSTQSHEDELDVDEYSDFEVPQGISTLSDFSLFSESSTTQPHVDKEHNKKKRKREVDKGYRGRIKAGFDVMAEELGLKGETQETVLKRGCDAIKSNKKLKQEGNQMNLKIEHLTVEILKLQQEVAGLRLAAKIQNNDEIEWDNANFKEKLMIFNRIMFNQ